MTCTRAASSTLGENTADNGGLRLAHMALLDVLATNPEKPLDGFTPEQQFFVGWGQIWCENYRPDSRVCLPRPTSTR